MRPGLHQELCNLYLVKRRNTYVIFFIHTAQLVYRVFCREFESHLFCLIITSNNDRFSCMHSHLLHHMLNPFKRTSPKVQNYLEIPKGGIVRAIGHIQ